MIEPINAATAQIAVAAAGRANDLAIWAQAACFQGVKQLDEIEVGITFELARI